MKQPITISLSPNTFPEDISAAWKALLLPATWHETKPLKRVAEKVSAYFPGYFLVPTSSGRQALYDVLRAYNIGKGDEVLMQAFTCIAVPEPITWVGAKPVYADIEADTYNFKVEDVRRKISDKTKAIIVQHTFGIPGPIEEILTIAREKKIIVIEDCAHAFGAKLHGKHIGTFGDAAIASFGRDKMLSSVFGGVAVFKDHALASKVQRYRDERPLPPAWWVFQQLLHPILFSLITKTYFSGFGKALLVTSQKLGLLSKAVAVEERKGARPNHIAWQYSPALASLLLVQLEHFASRLMRRATIVEEYEKALTNTGAYLPEVPNDARPSWLRFPLRVKNRDALMHAGKEAEMLLGDWYDAPLVPSTCSLEAFSYARGTCPMAERVSKEVINLPTYPRLTSEQIHAVIELTKSHLANNGN